MPLTFRCDPDAATLTAGQLSTIRSEMLDLDRTFDDSGACSDRIESALHHFYSHTSDNRHRMDQLLERGAGLLTTLADAVAEVEADLARSFGPDPAP